MSQSVIVTRTVHTHSTTQSAIIINSGYMKTIPGLLKLAELIIGGLCIGFIGWNFWSHSRYNGNTELFFLCMAVAFFIGTFCLLISCLISFSTGGIISKTIYELIYHSTAFILLLVASILFILKASDYYRNSSHPYMIAAILGLINSALYLISAIYARRSYKGI